MFTEQTGGGRADGAPGLTPPPPERKRSLIFPVDGLSAIQGKGGVGRGGEGEDAEGALTPPRVLVVARRTLPCSHGGGGATCPPSRRPPPPAWAISPSLGRCFSADPGCLHTRCPPRPPLPHAGGFHRPRAPSGGLPASWRMRGEQDALFWAGDSQPTQHPRISRTRTRRLPAGGNGCVFPRNVVWPCSGVASGLVRGPLGCRAKGPESASLGAEGVGGWVAPCVITALFPSGRSLKPQRGPDCQWGTEPGAGMLSIRWRTTLGEGHDRAGSPGRGVHAPSRHRAIQGR